MKYLPKILFFFLVLFSGPVVFAVRQDKASVDSLLNELSSPKYTGKEDTNKVNLLYQIALGFCYIHPEEGIKYGEQCLALANKLNWEHGIARSYNVIGDNYFMTGDYNKLLDYGKKALTIYEKLNDSASIAELSIDFGAVYLRQNDLPKALDIFLKALKTFEKKGNKTNVASIAVNLSGIYLTLNDYTRVIEYATKAIQVGEEVGDKNIVAMAETNIGAAYQNGNDNAKAIQYDLRALKHFEELGNDMFVAVVTGNIGALYLQQNNQSLAIEYAQKSIQISEKAGNKMSVAEQYLNIGIAYLSLVSDSSKKPGVGEQKEIPHSIPSATVFIPADRPSRLARAFENLNHAMELAKEIKASGILQNCYEELGKFYKEKGDYKQSLEYTEKFIAIKDSVFSQANNEKIVKIGLQDEYERKKVADSLKTADREKIGLLQLKHQRNYTYLGAAGFVLLLGFTFFITRNNKLLNKEKKKSESLLDQIKVKNKEITDNINYAQRIQSAILPDVKVIERVLENSFVLFLPKDIVSGDFYAFAEKNNKAIVIAGDCTGHGVSGAFMSMIASSLLNQIINERSVEEPAEILSQLNGLIIETLRQNQNDSNDGLDIAICSFDLKNYTLQYAGANRPLWLIRGNTLEVLKADKLPIGGLQAAEHRIYKNHTIRLEKDDSIYIFTDGYPDQFGGAQGKKMMTGKFRELLLQMQHSDMPIQHHKLEQYFAQWKGNNEQVDDVLVIGVRV